MRSRQCWDERWLAVFKKLSRAVTKKQWIPHPSSPANAKHFRLENIHLRVRTDAKFIPLWEILIFLKCFALRNVFKMQSCSKTTFLEMIYLRGRAVMKFAFLLKLSKFFNICLYSRRFESYFLNVCCRWLFSKLRISLIPERPLSTQEIALLKKSPYFSCCFVLK